MRRMPVDVNGIGNELERIPEMVIHQLNGFQGAVRFVARAQLSGWALCLRDKTPRPLNDGPLGPSLDHTCGRGPQVGGEDDNASAEESQCSIS